MIADISLDHQKFLGNTVTEIAREKVGIIRPGGVVVTLPQQPEANDVIGHAILDLNARAVSAVEYVPPVSPGSTICEDLACPYPLQVMGKQILVESPLAGRHQLRNVALAIAAANELSRQGFTQITPESIERGIRQTRWPGRFQVLPARAGWPEMVLDVAHNPAGAWALRSTLSQRYDGRPLIFVFGAMRDKAIAEMTEILFPLAEKVIATRPGNPRSAPPEEIQQAAGRTGTEIETISEIGPALERARALSTAQSVIVVWGSIYLVGEVMTALGVKN